MAKNKMQLSANEKKYKRKKAKLDSCNTSLFLVLMYFNSTVKIHASIHVAAANPIMYSKTCVKRPLSKRQKIGFQNQLSLNAGQGIAAFCNTFYLH